MFRRGLGVSVAVALGFEVESRNQTSDWAHWLQMAGKIENGDLRL